MNIFGIIGLSSLIGLLAFAVSGLIFVAIENEYCLYIGGIISICVLIAAVFIGIGLTTHGDMVYVEKYTIEKETLESSIHSELLSGAERVSLVNKAIELNGELAERKANFSKWYYVTYDKSIYDDVEFIKFK